jgi:hypothetical protein
MLAEGLAKGKMVFSEEKNQKTFYESSPAVSLSGPAEAKMIRRFLLLFFKKADLASCLPANCVVARHPAPRPAQGLGRPGQSHPAAGSSAAPGSQSF